MDKKSKTACFIIQENEDDSINYTINGNRHQLIELLLNAMQQDTDIKSLIIESVLIFSQLEQNYKNN